MRKLVTAQLEESGYAVIPDVVGIDEISQIDGFIDDDGKGVAGTRRLINRPWCRELAEKREGKSACGCRAAERWS